MKDYFDKGLTASRMKALSRHGVYLGTASWRYEGWLGLAYARDRYLWRGQWSESRFKRNCLAEYAETFRSVCVDGAYYQFPTEAYLEGLARQTPDGFQFSFKVTDEITIKRFPNLPRHSLRAGKDNENFLNADLFVKAFLKPCAAIQERVGMLIFEFSRFYARDFERGRDFVAALDAFLERLPAGWRYGVEVRNPNVLREPYFEMLARRGVAHVFNSWEKMPEARDQMTLAGDRLADTHACARFLAKPGRSYQEAVRLAQGYDRIREPLPAARAAAAELIQTALRRRTPLYLYTTNRFEGCSPMTLQAILDELPPWVWEAVQWTPPSEGGHGAAPARDELFSM